MEVVVDASALLAVVLDEPERGSVIAATVGATLISPMALPYEVGNALVALRKKNLLEEAEILPAWETTQRIPIQLVPVQMDAALALALAHGIYAYDAYYLHCSLSRRRPLVTLDRKMREVARPERVPGAWSPPARLAPLADRGGRGEQEGQPDLGAPGCGCTRCR